jgi:hypothetical protein
MTEISMAFAYLQIWVSLIGIVIGGSALLLGWG